MEGYTAFYIQWKWSDTERYQELKEFFMKYVHEGIHWLIGKEVSNDSHQETGGEHLHFCVEWNAKEYHRFAVAVKQKYKLRGKAVAGFPAQMKHVVKVRNWERMCAYTCKDGNVDTNYSEQELAVWRKQSFKKVQKEDITNKLLEFVTKCWDEGELSWNGIRYEIYKFHIVHNTGWTLTRNNIDSVIQKALMYHANKSESFKVEQVYELHFGTY